MIKVTNLIGMLATTLLIVGCGSSESSSSTTDKDTNTDLVFSEELLISESLKQDYLDAINSARAVSQDCGTEGIKPAVDALVWSDKLHAAAVEHSYDMAVNSQFTHDGSGTSSDRTAMNTGLGRGSSSSERITYNGYEWSYTGENIAKGAETAEEVIRLWIASDGHCANLMNPNFKDVGMAMVEDANTDYVYHWTQNFAAPR